jgi:hypothetical protein
LRALEADEESVAEVSTPCPVTTPPTGDHVFRSVLALKR